MTARQEEVLVAVNAFIVEHGYAPTTREIAAVFGLASHTTVHTHLELLRGFGMVDWKDGSPRTLHLTSKGKDAIVSA